MNRKQISSLLFLLLAVIFLPHYAFAQEKDTRKERKAREKEQQLSNFETAKQLLMDSTFIVPAETFQLSDGSNFRSVDGTINFLRVHKNDGMLQLGNGISHDAGRNNLGGITVSGTVSNVKYSFNERKNSLFMTFNLIGPQITARITITITGSNKALISVEGIYTGRGVNLRGPVQSIGETRIFKGSEF